jgi:hypothetical protein
LATTNKNFKVKNGLEVAGEIGVGSTPSYGTAGQALYSNGPGVSPSWQDVVATSTSTVRHQVKLGETIAKGQAVYVSSATGANMIVSKASNVSEQYSSKTMGLLETGGVLNDQVNVVTEGILYNVDVGAASAGDPVWLGESGNLIYGLGNKPIAPKHLVFIGIVTKDGTSGRIFIRPQNGFELNEIHNVLIGSNYASVPADNNLLAYDSANSLWTNQTAEQANVANLSGATFTGNVAGTNLGLSGKNIFSNTGTGAPTFTTYSSGVRTVFYDNVGGTSAGYTRGIDAGVLWDSIPAADAGMYFKWYGGQTQVASLSGTGIFTTTNVNATTVTANTLVGNTNASTITTGTIPSTILGNSSITINGSSIALNSTNSVITANTGNSIAIKFDGGTTENTDLYTFNGSAAKSLNIVAGSGISITKTANTITVNSTASGAANTFGTIVTPSGTSPVADTTTDTLTLSAGNGITITGDATADSITFTPNVASATVNGIVTTGTQTFAGDKIFSGNINATSSTSFVTVDGITRLGQAETQKIVDAYTNGYTLANNTYSLDISKGNYFTNISTQRLYNSSSGWTIVGTNAYSTALTATSPLTYTLLSSGSTAQGDVAIVVVTTDSATNALPTVNLTASPGWTTNSATATTYGSSVFYKTLGATPDTTIVLNYGSTDFAAVASIVIRSSGILPTYVSAIATPTVAGNNTGVPTPAATTTTIANTLVVTAASLRNDIVDLTQSATGPTGYSNYKLASSSAGTAGTAAASMLATKFVATVGTETPTAFAPKFANGTAVSDYWYSWTFQVSAYLDSTITLTNSSLSSTYPASTYVLHINNPSAITTTTWSGATYAWQGGTAPTLSSTAPNNIVILETINASTFRGALLDSYA